MIKLIQDGIVFQDLLDIDRFDFIFQVQLCSRRKHIRCRRVERNYCTVYKSTKWAYPTIWSDV